MKTLVIAEKPSVAGDLAKALGRVPKKGDFYENDEWVISSAVGHLVELYMPEDMSKDLKRWTLKTLPIVPPKFELKPIAKTKQKFQELKKLIARKDVGQIINACDAGREGELIFTYVNELAKGKKPVKRLWMSSMTLEAIKKAFANLRDEEEMKPLQDAARSRSEADWLIGINGTRGATVVFGRRGGTAATVGRVQTPTLSMIYQREMEIRNFKPRDYWRLVANFGVAAGEYEGVYQKPDFKKADDEHDRADRIWNKEDAERIRDEVIAGGPAEVTEEKKRTKQSSPRLYDLTSLQREANSRFGLAAGHTLNIAQALYEKHKMITYPRTDSRALPEDYGQTVWNVLRNLDEPYAMHAEKVLENKWIKTGNKRIFNDKQVSDHFAIIPTDAKPKKLSELEQKVFDLIARRTIAIFYPPAEFDVTTRISKVGEHSFKTEGKVLAVGGWMDVYGKGGAGEDTLTPLTDPDFARCPKDKAALADLKEAQLNEDQTKPPPRYSEATLLSAMEGAGKLVDDEELADAMKERGLGTPATRAQTIDHLAHEKYIARQGRELVPTQKAESLMEFLAKFDIEQLTSPAMTGEWEHRLRQVEEGELSREEFMKGIVAQTQSMVDKLGSPPPPEKTNIVSPTNGEPMLEDHRAWFSQDKVEIRGKEYPVLQVNKVIGNRKLEPEEVQELINKKEVGPLDGFTSRNGKAFSALLKITDKENGTQRVELDFGNNGEEALDESVDLSQYPEVGKSPIDGTPVRETPNAYVSEGRDPDGKPAFRLSRNMLSKALPPEEVRKLLAEKKTGLIQGFKSNRTGRLFDAHLLLKDDGKIGFEFPPRKKAAKKGARKAAKKAADKES
ncbi:MAG: DNA topoisomerase 3 [Puniceicoccales bacterium]